jgi:predicted 3-demethylubiquinone-9 3-methyltransferase (glyoxalase superfamily)
MKNTAEQKITTFITFNDQAEEALNLYVSLFKDSKVNHKSYYGSEYPQLKGKLMTATIELAGQRFMVLNAGPSFSFSQGFSLFVNCKDQNEIDELSVKLIGDTGEQLPCGWLRDKFGVSWQIIPSNLISEMQGGNPEGFKRMFAALMKMKKIDMAALQEAYDNE